MFNNFNKKSEQFLFLFISSFLSCLNHDENSKRIYILM
jgi:hypothetical protein